MKRIKVTTNPYPYSNSNIEEIGTKNNFIFNPLTADLKSMAPFSGH